MQKELEQIQQEALESISNATSIKELQDINVSYLGRKGSLTTVLRGMGKLSKEERPIIGELANKIREALQSAIDEKKELLEQAELEEKLKTETIDVTLPGRPIHEGGTHILTSIIEEIED